MTTLSNPDAGEKPGKTHEQYPHHEHHETIVPNEKTFVSGLKKLLRGKTKTGIVVGSVAVLGSLGYWGFHAKHSKSSNINSPDNDGIGRS